jgi:hypothetical protein
VKGLLLFFAIMMGGLIFLHRALQDGTFLRYIDQNPHERGVPKATFYLGQSYFLLQDLTQASTYFLRVVERYPALPMADDAYYSYLQCLDNDTSLPRSALIERYKDYLEKYPDGRHKAAVNDQLGIYTTSGR